MTIDSESDLFKAILAMDSYNRGYNAGIVFGTNPEDSEAINGQTQIGVATVYRSDGGTVAQADGFYAIAYQLPDDSVTIAYRGTDQAFDNSETGIGGDFENGYGIASEGKADTPQGMDSTFWLPIECAKAEIEEAKRFKSINGNYSYMWPQKEVPQKNSLSHQEFIESLSELVGSGSNYFYGYEGSGPNGPEPIRSYLKPGMTGRGIMGVKGRFSDRVKYDGWYEDSRVRGRWAIQLKPFTTDLKKIYAEKFGENINSTGKAAEVLFSKAFGTEVIRWSDTGKAYLGEYYRQDSPGIQEVSKYLEKRYPHPKGEWTSLSIM